MSVHLPSNFPKYLLLCCYISWSLVDVPTVGYASPAARKMGLPYPSDPTHGDGQAVRGNTFMTQIWAAKDSQQTVRVTAPYHPGPAWQWNMVCERSISTSTPIGLLRRARQ
jgi:hypothetical protein